MKKVLYIDCCIRREGSRTKKLADRFLHNLEQKGGYEITHLCLMDENLGCLTEGFFQQRQELLEKNELDHPRFRYAWQFQQADRIVIAAPFWDLAFPALLKVYLENVSVDGITFGCAESGLYGTCKSEKMVFLTTRGGSYANSPLEMGSRYLEALCEFFGIDEYIEIAADGLDEGKERPEEILQRSMDAIDVVTENF